MGPLWFTPTHSTALQKRGQDGMLGAALGEEASEQLLRKKTAPGSPICSLLPAMRRKTATHHGGVVVDQPASAHPEEKTAAGSRIRPPPWPAPTAEWAWAEERTGKAGGVEDAGGAWRRRHQARDATVRRAAAGGGVRASAIGSGGGGDRRAGAPGGGFGGGMVVSMWAQERLLTLPRASARKTPAGPRPTGNRIHLCRYCRRHRHRQEFRAC